MIVGAGLTGLVAAYQLSKIDGLKVTIVDKLSHPGGAFSSGSQFFNKVVIRKPAHQMLLELDIPFTEKDNYVTVKNPSSLISALLNKTLNHSKSDFVFLGPTPSLLIIIPIIIYYINMLRKSRSSGLSIPRLGMLWHIVFIWIRGND